MTAAEMKKSLREFNALKEQTLEKTTFILSLLEFIYILS
jgi:hypothetical protein